MSLYSVILKQLFLDVCEIIVPKTIYQKLCNLIICKQLGNTILLYVVMEILWNLCYYKYNSENRRKTILFSGPDLGVVCLTPYPPSLEISWQNQKKVYDLPLFLHSRCVFPLVFWRHPSPHKYFVDYVTFQNIRATTLILNTANFLSV